VVHVEPAPERVWALFIGKRENKYINILSIYTLKKPSKKRNPLLIVACDLERFY